MILRCARLGSGVADRLQLGTAAEQILVDPFGQRGQRPVLICEYPNQLLHGEDLVFLIGCNLKMGRQKIQNLLKNLSGNKNFLLQSCLPQQCLQWNIITGQTRNRLYQFFREEKI